MDAFNGHEGDDASRFRVAYTAANNCASATKQAQEMVMAEWDTEYINDLPDSAFACIDPGGEKDEQGKTVPRAKRHYPHHNRAGEVDTPHLRAGRARVRQQATTSCGYSHLFDEHELPSDEAAKSARALKFAGPDTIEGLAMPFGYDTDGESFTPQTDFCFEWFGNGPRPLLYEHGFDGKLKAGVVGRQTEYEMREEGIWAKSELDRAKKYRKAIDQLIEEGALGYSSGAMPHLATKDKKGVITRWPWVELSLTPIPAHLNAGIHYVKSADAVAHLEAVDVPIPDPLKAALAALDEWAANRETAPDSEPFTDHIARVSGEVSGLTDHAREYAEMRVKAGRVISAANRQRIASVIASRSALLEAFDELEALLEETDPDKAAKSAEEFWAARMEAERAITRSLEAEVQRMT
jgi:hypothetical protein